MAHMRWGCLNRSIFTKSKRFHNSYAATSRTFGQGFLQVSEEVQDAILYKKATVALESTIITHGMPFPENYQTASVVERLVRENRAVPATVAIIKGKICIGLKDAELLWLAENNKTLIKVSRSDLSYVLSQGLSGGTTVSSTMIAAHMAGIPVFATGGIGGVHRGAEISFDISTDLTELGRTPVAVVSSGVKSILDIPKTLEYLETQGVCVVTFGNNKSFPAFFTKDSGFSAPYNVATHMDAAELIDAQLRSGLGSGMLIAVPIPDEFAATGNIIQAAITQAVDLARKNHIIGKKVTPYILNMVNELTKGQSLVSNVALIKNNATVASRIASSLALIQAGLSPGNTQGAPLSLSRLPSQTTASSSEDVNNKKTDKKGANNCVSGRPVVVGATVVDFSVQVTDPHLQFNGATYKGTVSQTFGGVGRNMADCLSRLGCSPVFVSAIGADNMSKEVIQNSKHIDMQSVQKLDTVPTATYCPVLQANGTLLFGVGNMDINSKLDLNKVPDLDLMIQAAPLVLVDGNFSAEVLEVVVHKCMNQSVPVWFEPTDLFKSTKPFVTEAWRHLSFISPNLGELVSMYVALMENLQERHTDFDKPNDSSTLEVIISSCVEMCRKIVVYIPVVLVTLGKHGVLLCHCWGDVSHLLPLPVARTSCRDEHFKAIYYRALNVSEGTKIVSVSGAGDCFASAFVAGMLQGSGLNLCVQQGMLAAAFSLQSSCAVPETITNQTVLNCEALSAFSDWQPFDVTSGHF